MGVPANIIALLLLPLTVIVGGAAIWQGRTAERMAGLALLGTLVLQIIVMLVSRRLGATVQQVAPVLDVAISLILGLVFLWAALKHNSRWLGFAFFVQGAELTISAYFLGPDAALAPGVYYRLLNIMTLATVILLAIATGQAILNRRRERPQEQA
ncbi:hypothetical protein [Caulobacter sp. RHG1]|uniref:hypothetical protein n=1 Tax=Caulobacter sp. (strain RHG1) TaxID=2545762 RepID=UPI001554ABC6|nr:hypothetical protein [Caulobacter sp. RHG1]NQE63237.1 hypothetical protein [Caulobacter sp. RHG1]